MGLFLSTLVFFPNCIGQFTLKAIVKATIFATSKIKTKRPKVPKAFRNRKAEVNRELTIMKTFKTFALAAIMTIFGTATSFAGRTPDLRHNNRNNTTVVVIDHNRHHHDIKCHKPHIKTHRHLNRPVDRCLCKHCKKMRHDMAKKMHRMEKARRHRR